jgi:hypothetical protein
VERHAYASGGLGQGTTLEDARDVPSSPSSTNATTESLASRGRAAYLQPARIADPRAATVANPEGNGNTGGERVEIPGADRVPTPGASPSAKPKGGSVTIQMSPNMLAGGTGCHTWDAGFFLTEFVLGHPELFEGELWL